MKIVHIIESFGGGCLTYLTLLTKNLPIDLEQTILYSTRKETPRQITKLFSPHVKLKYLNMNIVRNPFYTVWVLVKLIQILIKEKPDIVHCHSSVAGFLGRIAAKILKIPSIYTPHGFSFQVSGLGCRQCVKQKIFYVAEWLLAYLGDITVACGKEEFRLAQQLPNKRIYVVYNGIDLLNVEKILTSLENNKDCDSKNKKLSVGYFGRTTFPHRVDLFNQIAMTFYKKYNFVWIGASLDDTKLFSCIEKTGWLEHNEAIKKLAEVDVVLHLTVYDGLSYALLESMALRKPVIAWDIPSSRAVIQNGQTGFLVSNLDALQEKVRILLENSELRKIIGESAHDSIAKHYSSIAMANRYLKIYKELLFLYNK